MSTPKDKVINLKGKEYLMVADRIVWIRRDHENTVMQTELLEHDSERGYALFKATVTLPDGGSATGYGSQSRKQFGDYLEKAETKALGRALGMLGYGTAACQFDDDNGNVQIVDAPLNANRQEEVQPASSSLSPEERDSFVSDMRKAIGLERDRVNKMAQWLRKNHNAPTGINCETVWGWLEKQASDDVLILAHTLACGEKQSA